MTTIEIKNQMMELWQETFGDSEEYVRLVFDTYFDPRFVEYEERGGKIVGALLGIPRRFGDSRRNLSALYLCGLATKPEFRGGGVMSRLMKRIASRFSNSAYSFIFLIPANRGLWQFYRDRGFVSAFYLHPSRYAAGHDFIREIRIKLELLPDDEKKLILANLTRFVSASLNFDDPRSEDLIRRLNNFISDGEDIRPGMNLIHEPRDLDAAIEECRIAGGEIFYVENPEREISAVGFLYPQKGETKIYFLRFADEISRAILLQKVGEKFSENEIYICNDLAKENENQIRGKYYASSLKESPLSGSVSEMERVQRHGEDSKNYGMAKILNVSEILKFLHKGRENLKYSILVKNENSGKIYEYSSGGESDKLDVREVNRKNVNSEEVISEQELAAVLFRQPKGDDLVGFAFGLPALEGEISLMLD